MKYKEYIELEFERVDMYDSVEFENTGYYGFCLNKKINNILSISVNSCSLNSPKLYIKKYSNIEEYHIINLTDDMVRDLLKSDIIGHSNDMVIDDEKDLDLKRFTYSINEKNDIKFPSIIEVSQTEDYIDVPYMVRKRNQICIGKLDNKFVCIETKEEHFDWTLNQLKNSIKSGAISGVTLRYWNYARPVSKI